MPVLTNISSYTPRSGINLVNQFVHGIPLGAIEVQVSDIVNSMIWVYYPWSWTVSSFTPMLMTQGVQDYFPTNTDILRPLRMRVCRLDTVPQEWRELTLLQNLSPELTRQAGLETFGAVGWYASGPFFRMMYAASIGTGQILQLQGEYQKVPTKITADLMDDPLAIPDRYFDVFVEGLKWKAYQLADDPRAGNLVFSKNGTQTKQYSGQLGIFYDMLYQMARTEDLGAGDQFEWPEQPLGVGRSYWPGLYGI